MNELISVVVPLFNKESYIDRTIKSVLEQSYQNFELIIVDDGSTDKSVEVVRGFADPRIKLIRQKNGGVSSARNRGIQEAEAPLIAFLDADDAYKPDFLKMIMDLQEQFPDAGAYATNYIRIDHNHRTKLGTGIPPKSPCLLDVNDFFKLSLQGSAVCSSSVAVKKTVFNAVGGFPAGIKLGEDLDTWIRIIFSYPIAFDARVGMTYFENIIQRTCVQTPSVREPYFFKTIDELCSRQPRSREELENIYEFKNFFILIYAIHQIQEFSSSEGRKVLLACRTKYFLSKKWRWIATSLLPRKIYNAFRALKKSAMFNLSPFRSSRPKPAVNKIKVLHIIKTLNMGGAEVNLLNLIKTADHQRFDMYAAYSAGGELEQEFIRADVKLFKFSEKNCKLKSLETIGIISRLTKFIKENNIQFVHTHTFNAHVWGSVAAKCAGAKIIEHVHDSRYLDPDEFERRGETSKQYRFIRFLKNVSDMVIVLTKQNYDFIVSRGLHPAQRVREIQNGIDIQEIKILSKDHKETLKRRFGIPNDAPVVLTPIRFSPEKNLNILLDILLNVRKLMPQTICLVAGDGPERSKFEAMVRSLGAEDQIKTIGFYPDIPGLLNIVDVFLLPSTIELHSIAIMEAMRQKVPVVVSRDVGCNDEFIINGKNGILLDPFTNKDWADAIVLLLKDPQLRREIGESGYKTCIEKFNIRDVTKRFEELYVELAAS